MNSEIERMMEAFVSKLIEVLGRRMVFFVGAGISISSGVPSFRALNERVIRLTTGDKLGDEEYKFLSENLRPEVVLQILEEELGSNVLTCLEAFVGHDPNSNHFFLAEALRRGNWVFTTNGDNLIEQACELRGIDIKNRVCYKDTHFEWFEELLKSISNPQNTPGGYIFKLHGSVEEDEEDERFRTFLLTLHQVGRGLNETKEGVLKYFLQNFNFCFMGYSCLDDFSIYPVLRDTDSERVIFWFKYAKGQIGEIIWGRERLQNEREVEESRSAREKNWETINVNSVLLKRRASFKFVGDSSEFVQNRFCPPLEIERCAYPDLLKPKKYQDGFFEWAKDIEEYRRNLILGRLWEECWRRDEAILYFEEAEKLGEGKQRAKAKQMLARVYDRQYGKEKAEVAINYYEGAYDIFKKFSADLEAAQAKMALANFKRRVLQQFSEAKKDVEEAKLLLEFKKDESEGYVLAYARCINILGLIHLQHTELKTETGYDLCEESKKLKEKYGDVDGVAESENAIGLTLRGLARGEAEIIKKAIDNFETARTCMEKIGNYRGCGQHFRNLGLCYTDLIKLIPEKGGEYFHLAKESYEKGIANWHIIKPGEPPVEELLEFRFRLGELHVKYGDKNEAIKHLQPVEQKRRELGDWHNRVRCLHLLREAYVQPEQKISISHEIVSIYRDVLSDESKLKEMREAKIKFRNAIEILERTKEIALDIISPPEVAMEEAEEVNKILKNLKKRIEEIK